MKTQTEIIDELIKGCGKRLADKDTWCGINKYWCCSECKKALQTSQELLQNEKEFLWIKE